MVMQVSIQSAVAGGSGPRKDGEPDRKETAYGGSLELYTALEESAGFLSLVLRCAEKKLKKFLERTDTVVREMR
jgi:hypothetical protein